VRDLDVASGGPSRSGPALAESQSSDDGLKVTVLYQDRGNLVVPLFERKVQYKAFVGSDLFFGKFLNQYLRSGAEFFDDCIFHLHGLWSPTLHRSARIARKHEVPYVVSTRGMLANWALDHKALKKKIAWRLYQKRDLAGAEYLLASSEFERREVESLLPDSKVVAIPNGCEQRPDDIQSPHVLPGDKGVRWVLAIGRLHPVKGYAELIEAWAGLNPAGWKLAIAGPDEGGYRKKLEDLIGKLELADQVFLLGEVDDTQKWSLLDRCELFVAPSRTENFGMAIAEALQSGTPVITTKGTPWRELHENDCGWWIELAGDELDMALKAATGADGQVLREMGGRGHRLIVEKYSWRQAAQRTIDLYRSVLSGQ